MRMHFWAVAASATALALSAGSVQAQPMVTTKTVTTVTTTRQAPQGDPQGYQEPMYGYDNGPHDHGQVVYQGRPDGRADGAMGQPMPMEEGHMGYPETHVWQAHPGEFPHDWAPMRTTSVRRVKPVAHHALRHSRRVYVNVRDSHGRPVPVMVQTVNPYGERETVPAVIRPSGVPTVVRATGANPPPVMWQVEERSDMAPGAGPMYGSDERDIHWAQERREGMPPPPPPSEQDDQWDRAHWDHSHWAN